MDKVVNFEIGVDDILLSGNMMTLFGADEAGGSGCESFCHTHT